jgi:hypothetical protein
VVKPFDRKGSAESEQIIRARARNQTRVGQITARSELKKVTTGLEPAVHVQLKILSARLGRTIEDLLRDAIEDLIKKHAEVTSGQRS